MNTAKTTEKVLKSLNKITGKFQLPDFDETKKLTQDRLTQTLKKLGFVTQNELETLEARVSALEAKTKGNA